MHLVFKIVSNIILFFSCIKEIKIILVTTTEKVSRFIQQHRKGHIFSSSFTCTIDSLLASLLIKEKHLRKQNKVRKEKKERETKLVQKTIEK